MNKLIQISIFLWLVADAYRTGPTFDELLAIPVSKTLSPALFPKQFTSLDNAARLVHNRLHNNYQLGDQLAHTTYAQRLEIIAKYQERYNESLMTKIYERNLEDEYLCFYEALLIPREYVAFLLHHTLSNPETMNATPLQMLSAMPSSEKRDVIAAFNTRYGSLETKIDEAVTDEQYNALLHKLVETERSESESRDIEQAVVDAVALYKSEVDYRFRTTDTSIIDEILCNRSIAQLKLTRAIFRYDLQVFPQNALLHTVTDIPGYYADEIEYARANMDFCTISWVLGVRSDIDMLRIANSYDKKYRRKAAYNMEDAISMSPFYRDVVSILLTKNYDLDNDNYVPEDYDY